MLINLENFVYGTTVDPSLNWIFYANMVSSQYE